MKPERVGAVVNPHSGSGNAARLFAELSEQFPEADVEATITTGQDHVSTAAIAQAKKAELVVAIGGDGTLREVAAALVDADIGTPLFVVPAGRGNSSYRHLYGDTDWRSVAARLANGIERRPLEVGRVDATPDIEPPYFVLGFTAGLFRSALGYAEQLRRLPGAFAYLLATGWATLSDDPVELSLSVDGDPMYHGATRVVAIGGGRYRGSDFELLPESRRGDGRLHALVVEPVGARDAVRLVRRAKAGRIIEDPSVRYATGETVRLRSEAGLPVELDGTPVSEPVTAAELEVVPEALSVAYPAE